jgi:hypothetical protein
VVVISESDADENSGSQSNGGTVGGNRSGRSGGGDDGNIEPPPVFLDDDDDDGFANSDNSDELVHEKQSLYTNNLWVDPIELARSCGCAGSITTSSWLEYLLSDEMDERVHSIGTHLLHMTLGRKGGGGPLPLIVQHEAKLRERCALLASGKDWKMRMRKHGPVYTNCAPSDFTLRMLLQKWLSKIDGGHMDLRGFWSDWDMIRMYNKLVTRVLKETREIADIQTSDEEVWESDQDLQVVDDGEGGTDEDEAGEVGGSQAHPSFHLEEMQRRVDAQHEDDEMLAMVQRAKERATADFSGSDLSNDSDAEPSGQEEVYEDALDRAERQLRLKKRSSEKKKSASKRRLSTSKRTPFKGKGKRLFGSESSSSSSDSDSGPKSKDKKEVECAICLETITEVCNALTSCAYKISQLLFSSF